MEHTSKMKPNGKFVRKKLFTGQRGNLPMIERIVLMALIAFVPFAQISSAQNHNPNLASLEKGATFSASSTYPNPPWMAPPANVADGRRQLRWETDGEKEGAWLQIAWKNTQKIRELWIVNKAIPYDFVLDPYMRTANYLVPRKVKITFSDGSSLDAELRLAENFQILTFPEVIETSSLKFTVEQVWENSGEGNTGLCKVKAFPQQHEADFRISVFEMYDVQNDQPVQSAKIEILNPGKVIENAELQITRNGKEFGKVKLAEIPAHSASIQQIWIPIVYRQSKLTFAIECSPDIFRQKLAVDVAPYRKTYFDGGTFDIINTNHNDLGWLDTQANTADYRSKELIGPALDLMQKNPEFKYTMESVEYLKEFLQRHPERKGEMAQRMLEKRFTWGASYIQNLQAHVGPEKLIRQFYYGRRWLKENFSDCDTRFYMNTDVPGFTYQLPQILKKAGIDYIIQGRFPWGFYYWTGLDGTSIPMFAFRYAAPSRLMNPKNNEGWLKFLNEREYYYQPRQLPKSVLYDFNADYLPPCPDLIPFAKNQNTAMEKFAAKWNEHFKSEPEMQIHAPKIRFVEPEEALREFFGKGEANIETVKGDWPLSWAYYDEPGNREGLLFGRKGHNALLAAEGLYSWLKVLDPATEYPKDQIDAGWLANCWPDHGWGGNRGTTTDSFYVASYDKSLKIASELNNAAGKRLLNHLPQGNRDQIPVLVYNSIGWKRTDIVNCTIHYPASWKGIELKDANGSMVPVEVISHSPEKHSLEIAFLVKDTPAFGFKAYYATMAKEFPQGYAKLAVDVLENDYLKVEFGAGGISSLYDKKRQRQVLRTDKFFGGEVIQMSAPDRAWESLARVTMEDFDRTSLHEFKTVRAVESPIRCLIEKEAKLKYFTLRQRFILNKHAQELVIEADVLDWPGQRERELRIVFPMNLDKSARASYEIPFGTVEMGRDEIDYSYLPDNYECQFQPQFYGRNDLPFREAVNWVDVSSGSYQGNGCLFASDMTVHLFRDETADPVNYPLVQHVLLSTRESLAWNPLYWFTQPGNHSYRMALHPHDGNWRFAYKHAWPFNSPLMAFCGKGEQGKDRSLLPLSAGLLSVEPENIIISAVKQAEDDKGLVVRFYEAEGRYTKAKIRGFKPFAKAFETDMLEYEPGEIAVEPDGSTALSTKPWEIKTVKIFFLEK